MKVSSERGAIEVPRRETETTNWEWVHLLPLQDRRDLEALERARQALQQTLLEGKAADAEERAALVRRHSYATLQSSAEGRADGAPNADEGRKAITPLTLLRVLKGDREKERTLAERVQRHARVAYGSYRYQLFQILVTVLSCAMYVAETYVDLDGARGARAAFTAFEVCAFLVFLYDLLVHIFAAEFVVDYVRTSGFVVDVLALLPIMAVDAERQFGFLKFLRILKAARLLRISRLQIVNDGRRRAAGRDGSGFAGAAVASAEAQSRELVRETISMVVSTLGLIFVAGAVVHTVELKEGGYEDARGGGLAFHDALYFVVATVTTVGYGDIVPVSDAARSIMAIIICLAFVLIPYRVKLLLEVLRGHSAFLGRYRRKHVSDRHLVLMGSVTFENLSTSLRELYHEDHHENRNLQVVVLSPAEPSRALLALLHCPAYRSRVTYLRGSPLNAVDLERAAVPTAACVTVLINKLSAHPREEDTGVVLRAMSVANACQETRRRGRGPVLLTELLRPQATRHLRHAGLRHVLCLDALKLSLFAQGCLCPGLPTLLSNLMRSHAPMPPEVLLDASWYVEYYMGAAKQLYVVELSPSLQHVRFDAAAAKVFEEFEVVLLGVYAQGRALLNPGRHYAIGKHDHAFVLAESAADARNVWNYMHPRPEDDDELLALLRDGAGHPPAPQDHARRLIDSCKMRRAEVSHRSLIDEWDAACGRRRGGGAGPGGDPGPGRGRPRRRPAADAGRRCRCAPHP